MAYKGILYDDNKFEIIEYNDPNAKYEMQDSYSFIENGKSGIFIVRKTKEEVLSMQAEKGKILIQNSLLSCEKEALKSQIERNKLLM